MGVAIGVACRRGHGEMDAEQAVVVSEVHSGVGHGLGRVSVEGGVGLEVIVFVHEDLMDERWLQGR